MNNELQDVSLQEANDIQGGNGCSDFWGGVANGLAVGALLSIETGVGVGLGIGALFSKIVQGVAC
jgi:hypothetical protein